MAAISLVQHFHFRARSPSTCSNRLASTTLTSGQFGTTCSRFGWTSSARVFTAAMGGDGSVSTSAPPEGSDTRTVVERVGSVKQKLSTLVKASLQTLFQDDIEPLVAICQAKFGDYQCNNAMGLWSQLKGKSTDFKNPNSIGQAISKNLPQSEIIESTSVAGPGFVNIKLSDTWISKNIHDMLVNGIEHWAPVLSINRAVVDFSSPNIAKEMHVGHLRSTIIGDTLSRMLEYSNVEVLRRNHVGDWGTQFGMLIEYLFDQFPNWEDAGDQAIGDLQAFYKASKKEFDDDPDFRARAQRAVVKLQSGEDIYRNAWKKICEISRKEFDLVYCRLRVHLEEKGESFYNPYIPKVLNEFEEKNLIKESEGARVIEIDGYDIPLIVVKRDGGFNYASTDLAALCYCSVIEATKHTKFEGTELFVMLGAHRAKKSMSSQFLMDLTLMGGVFTSYHCFRFEDAMPPFLSQSWFKNQFILGQHVWYRLNVEKAEWIIYVTDVGQQQHFEMFFRAARLVGWLPDPAKNTYPKTNHVGFGLVLGSDGKRFRTRSSEVVRLVELLDEAKNRSKAELQKRLEDNGKITEWTDDELDSTAEAIGYGAVKYADLKNNRLTNYTFSYDQMLNDKGNTAVYLLYAHARICSIIKKSGKDIEELKKSGKIDLRHPDERALGIHLIQFAEIVEEACSNLLPNVLCEYLYNLSEMFTRFYTSCQVIGSAEEVSRLLLCEATATVMRKCFHLLGITPVYRI